MLHVFAGNFLFWTGYFSVLFVAVIHVFIQHQYCTGNIFLCSDLDGDFDWRTAYLVFVCKRSGGGGWNGAWLEDNPKVTAWPRPCRNSFRAVVICSGFSSSTKLQLLSSCRKKSTNPAVITLCNNSPQVRIRLLEFFDSFVLTLSKETFPGSSVDANSTCNVQASMMSK